MKEKKEPASMEGEKIRVGTALIKQLSSSFYPKTYMIFDELVSNSRDAGATEVKLGIYKDHIEVDDNGDGMDRAELVKFFYISSTHKAQKTERYVRGVKRDIIGKFGIGKISMYQICNKFRIESWRDGVLSYADFNFAEFEKSEYIDNFFLDVKSKPTDKKGSGTKILMTELKLERKIRFREIRKNLQMNLPLSHDFKLILAHYDQANPLVLETGNMVQGTPKRFN